MSEMKRTAPLNSGDDALVTALTVLARVTAQHVANADDFIEDLRHSYWALAEQTQEGPVGRNVYIALAELLPEPSETPD